MIQDDTRVESDKMVVAVNKLSNKVEQMYLYGRVKIIGDKQTVTSEYGEYRISTRILVLKNNVKLYKDGNIITGETLHYDFKLRQANLVGDTSKVNNKRVKAVIVPASKTK